MTNEELHAMDAVVQELPQEWRIDDFKPGPNRHYITHAYTGELISPAGGFTVFEMLTHIREHWKVQLDEHLPEGWALETTVEGYRARDAEGIVMYQWAPMKAKDLWTKLVQREVMNMLSERGLSNE